MAGGRDDDRPLKMAAAGSGRSGARKMALTCPEAVDCGETFRCQGQNQCTMRRLENIDTKFIRSPLKRGSIQVACLRTH